MRIAITGAGIVSAIGVGKHATLQSLREGRSGIGPMRFLPSVHTELPVGEVPFSDDGLRRLANVTDASLDRTTLMAIVAIDEALAEARLSRGDASGRRIRLVSGTTVGALDSTDALLRLSPAIQDGTTVSTACSSALNAIMTGADMLRSGEADVVIAGGTEALSIFHLNGFNSLMILDHQRCRPFDDERAGLNLGEGAAYVILERADEAEGRAADPLAYVSGYANACDAFHQTATSPEGEGPYLAMSRALNVAGLAAADIRYINAHGTGTPNNDASESAAILRLFGPKPPLVSSTKSFTGHTTSASGSVEAVICLLAMLNRMVPANLGFATRMPDGITPTMGMEDVDLPHVMCNSFGFGGNDSSLILSLRPTAGLPAIGEQAVRTLALNILSGEDDLQDIRNYVKPMEARRMGVLVKAALLTALRAIAVASVRPDAIVVGTARGCEGNNARITAQLQEEGEETVSPTLFMQSTHNTIASTLAIRLGCHGHNITYMQGAQSLQCAVDEAHRLLRSGRVRHVLVGAYDENPLNAISLILTCE